jgi:hypothetical protein
MTPADLLFTLIDRGVRLKVVEDRLVYVAPRGAMTPELVEQLRELKAEVVGLVVRRMCATCGSAGRCERRMPMPDGGWACQAALDAGLLLHTEADADLRPRHSSSGQPAEVRVWITGKQASPEIDTPGAGCGEKVQVRTAEGQAWARCTGPATCDGVCTHAETQTERSR